MHLKLKLLVSLEKFKTDCAMNVLKLITNQLCLFQNSTIGTLDPGNSGESIQLTLSLVGCSSRIGIRELGFNVWEQKTILRTEITGSLLVRHWIWQLCWNSVIRLSSNESVLTCIMNYELKWDYRDIGTFHDSKMAKSIPCTMISCWPNERAYQCIYTPASFSLVSGVTGLV